MVLLANGSPRLAIRADAADVRAASAWLDQICTEHGVPADQIFRLDLCLNEALANIISHGTSSAFDAPVFLSLQVSAGSHHGQAELEVSDTGRAFNPLTARATDRPRTLEEATPGGVGLTMMKSYSDRLDYDFRDGRNHLKFEVRWNMAG